jgi:nicotinate phosphoribosyltransferase
MAHADEAEAFRAFLDIFPAEATLLVDTYNVRAAVEKIIALGRKPRGIRLDSGDVLADSLWARERLDRAGWTDVQIFVSGDLDQNGAEALLGNGAPLNAFGVGTALSTSSDAPSLSVIYKLVEVEHKGEVRNAAKFSEEKHTYPGRKQVFRFSDTEELYSRDIIGLEDETFTDAEPLLLPVMRQGRRLQSASHATPQAGRQRFIASRERLPRHIRALPSSKEPFPVLYSGRLEQLCVHVRQSLTSART